MKGNRYIGSYRQSLLGDGGRRGGEEIERKPIVHLFAKLSIKSIFGHLQNGKEIFSSREIYEIDVQ